MNTLFRHTLLLKNIPTLCLIIVALLSQATLWAQAQPMQIEETLQRSVKVIKTGQKISFPQEAILKYQNSIGMTALMTFNQAEGQYQTSLQFNIPFFLMEFNSSGQIQDKQIIPNEYTDMRKGKLYSQASFDHNNQVVIFGKATEEKKIEPMQGIPQDYLSLVWQLALNPDVLKEPIQITNGKTLSIQDKGVAVQTSTIQLSNQKVRTKFFKIDKENGGLEFALAPDFANMPVQITFLNNGAAYTFYLTDMTLDGQNHWQRPIKHMKAQ